jgi:hypothetical protein
MVDIDEVKEFFFEAALRTWAGEGEKTTFPDLPGSKVLVLERGEFRYVDLYYVAEGSDFPESFGQTTIWVANTPVWGMQYGGKYEEEVIPFLKDALKHAYERCLFNGGRGPSEFRETYGLTYTNTPGHTKFDRFWGREEINTAWGEPKGWHRYQGFLLPQDDSSAERSSTNPP